MRNMYVRCPVLAGAAITIAMVIRTFMHRAFIHIYPSVLAGITGIMAAVIITGLIVLIIVIIRGFRVLVFALQYYLHSIIAFIWVPILITIITAFFILHMAITD